MKEGNPMHFFQSYQYPHNESKLVGYIETKFSRKDMTWIEDYLIYRLNPVWNLRYNITTNWQCCILKPSTLEFLQGFANAQLLAGRHSSHR
jgi:hypothetical protein